MSDRLVLGTVVLVALLIGINFSMIKFGLDHTTPLLFASMRTVIGGSFLILFGMARGERIPTDPRDLGRILVVSLSITTVSSALLIIGISRVPAGVASLVSSTMPLFTALLAFALLKTPLTRVAGFALAVGFAGTATLASPSLSGSAALLGIVALVVSALAWAFGTVYMKWTDLSRVSPIMLVGVQLIMSACVLVPVALIFEGTAKTEWTIGLFLPLLYAAIPSNAITFALLATVVRYATPTQAAATAYLIPLFGVLFGWILRGESLGLVEFIGGLLVIAGVYILVNNTAKQVTAASKPIDATHGAASIDG